ncbi:hypothetical protein ACYZTX_16245 [Pseudomonas sp. MDT1-17]
MKNHIGYLESTALKHPPYECAGQKKKLPTKNTRIHTVFVVFTSCHTTSPINAIGITGVNLPQMFGPEAML